MAAGRGCRTTLSVVRDGVLVLLRILVCCATVLLSPVPTDAVNVAQLPPVLLSEVALPPQPCPHAANSSDRIAMALHLDDEAQALFYGGRCGHFNTIDAVHLPNLNSAHRLLGYVGTAGESGLCSPQEGGLPPRDRLGERPALHQTVSSIPRLAGSVGGGLLIAQGMPASNLHHVAAATAALLHNNTASPSHVAESIRVAGIYCSFSQQIEAALYHGGGGAAAATSWRLTDVPLPPIDSIAYRAVTGELFIGFHRTVARVTDGRIQHYAGIPNRIWNATTAPSVPLAPQDPRLVQFRSLGQISLGLGATVSTTRGVLVVPDSATGKLWAVNLSTQLISLVAGRRQYLRSWPPSHPCLYQPLGCPATNITLHGLGGCVSPANDAVTFCYSRMFPTIFAIDLVAGRVRLVSGNSALQIVAFEPVVAQVFFGALAFSDHNRTLYVAGVAGVANEIQRRVYTGDVASFLAPLPDPVAPVPPSIVCPNTTCVGHGEVYGLVATGCFCECLRGWHGAQCEFPPTQTRTAMRSATRTTTTTTTTTTTATTTATTTRTRREVHTPTRSPPADAPVVASPPPVPSTVPKAISTTAEAVAATTTATAGLVNPGTATSVARALGVIGALNACEEKSAWTSARLPFPANVFPPLGVGSSNGRFHRGAVLASAIILVLTCVAAAVFEGLTNFLRRGDESRWAHTPSLLKLLLRRVRFPSILLVAVAFVSYGLVLPATALISIAATGGTHAALDVVLALVSVAVVVAGIIGTLWLVQSVVYVDYRHTGPRTLADQANAVLNGDSFFFSSLPNLSFLGRTGQQEEQRRTQEEINAARKPLVFLPCCIDCRDPRKPLPPKVAAVFNSKACRHFLFGDSAWMAPPGIEGEMLELATEQLASSALVFGRFRGSADGGWDAWLSVRFLAIEMALTTLAAVFEGLAWLACVPAFIGILVVNLAALLITLRLRPYAVLVKNVVAVVVAALTTIATLLALIAVLSVDGSPRRQALQATAASVATVAALCSFVTLAQLVLRRVLLLGFQAKQTIFVRESSGHGNVLNLQDALQGDQEMRLVAATANVHDDGSQSSGRFSRKTGTTTGTDSDTFKTRSSGSGTKSAAPTPPSSAISPQVRSTHPVVVQTSATVPPRPTPRWTPSARPQRPPTGALPADVDEALTEALLTPHPSNGSGVTPASVSLHGSPQAAATATGRPPLARPSPLVLSSVPPRSSSSSRVPDPLADDPLRVSPLTPPHRERTTTTAFVDSDEDLL